MKDGGPAFPLIDCNKETCTHESCTGMSLRDWFAGKCLSGMMADPTIQGCDTEVLGRYAEYCYRMADAMLAERSTP